MADVLKWIKKNIPLIVVSVLFVAFFIATIVLAVRLNQAYDRINELEKPPVEAWEENYRIPTQIIPQHYNLLLNPNLESGTFTGSVAITLEITDDVSYIPIHVKRLSISSYELVGIDSSIDLEPAVEYEPNQFFVIQPTKGKFQKGTYRYKLEFAGSLTDSIVGFYLSDYDDGTGKRLIVSSKFEPTDARKAYPCFDEPNLKAEFTIRLVKKTSDTEYIALSNMPQVLEENNSPAWGYTTITFGTSPKMSTYLSCFIICDFLPDGDMNIEGTDTQLRVYSRKNLVSQTALARAVAEHSVPYYNAYFGINYSLPKLDLIAIPDFVSGAMENWGLITFRETSMLYNDTVSSVSNQFSISSTVAHELAHMWFGDLVTMLWWDDIWLNEGFASFMSTKALHNYSVEWDSDGQFVVDSLHSVMAKDAQLSSHPIIQKADNPDQITSLFDSISYDKGEAMLRMLEDYLTPSVFQQGIQNYLNKHIYENAKSEDLWLALGEVSGKDVKTLMDRWTNVMGYPLITTKRNGVNIILNQIRYLANVNGTQFNETELYKWTIPIKVQIARTSGPGTITDAGVFNQDEETFDINDIPSSVSWFKLNPGQYGFYRVDYDDESWSKITANIAQIGTKDRANLIEDAFSFANSGHKTFKHALDLSRLWVNEANYIPWSTAWSKLNGVIKKLSNNLPTQTKFKSFVGSLVQEKYGTGLKVNWVVDPIRDSYEKRRLRTVILDAACSTGITGTSPCLTDVSAHFAEYLSETTNNLHPDIRSLAYFYGIQQGTDADWDKMWTKYLEAMKISPQEVQKIQQGLAASKTESKLKLYLSYSENREYVRSQDFFNVLSYIASNPVGTPLVWNYFKNNYEKLVSEFSLNSRPLGNAILSITSSFSTIELKQDMENFYAAHPNAGAGEAPRRQALENVENNIQWVSDNLQEITSWLDALP